MQIEIQNLIPLPMIELDTRGSEIWEAESFFLNPGEKILFYAGSGKGKTTLLSILYGLRNDFQGNVFFDGINIKNLSSRKISDLRKRNLSYIFQGLELFDELSALENIWLKNRQTQHKTESEIQKMARELGIYEFMNRKAGILSFGQRQRVAIIRALCQPFDFLLADEMFSHLDPDLKEVAMQLVINEVENQKAGLLLTSLKKENSSVFNKSYRI